MSSVVILKRLTIVIIVLSFAGFVQAQYIIEQKESLIPVNYDLLPEDTEFENPMDEAKYFLTLPEEKLKSGDMEIEENISTMYLDGENFAMEMSSDEQGKVTSIYDAKKKIFYYVLWAQKKVYQMTDDDMKQIQKDAEALKSKMMEGLSPEMRKQVEEQMKLDTKSKTAKVSSTGKKMKKYGFDCSQYMIETEDELKVVWASDDLPGLRKAFEEFAEHMAKIFPSEEEDTTDEWELIKGKIPVETRSMRGSMNMMGSPEIEITALTKIMKATPPADKFVPPTAADGFTYGSMKDMMSGMMQMMQEE